MEDDESWVHFLKAAGLSEERVAAAIEVPKTCDVPVAAPWVQKALQLCGARVTPAIGAAAVVKPWLGDARRRLASKVRKLNAANSLKIDLKVVRGLSEKLESELLELAIRPVVLEANIAEQTFGAVGAHADALSRLSESHARLEFLGLYPGLALAVFETCKRWIESTEELLLRLMADFPDLQERFPLSKEERVRMARFADSDPHDGGRRVVIVQFASGTRIVYKPRSIQTYALYQAALLWLNNEGFEPQFRSVSVLDRGEWGWLEFVSWGNCQQRGEVERFYRRLGGHLALLRLLGATDCHYENLIAEGEHPQLIDLETMLGPQLSERSNGGADAAAAEQIMDSVLSTGLLPSPTFLDGKLVDLSATGARSYQDTPLKAFQVEAGSNGRLHVAPAKWRLGRTYNRPRLAGGEVEPWSFKADIELGFRAAYDCLLRRQLTSSKDLLSQFRQAEIRFLLRPTAAYASLLRESYHPNALHDGTERDRILSELWRAPQLQRWRLGSVASEYQQLRRGDIPFFRGNADSAHVYAERSAPPVLVGVRSGIEAAMLRLERMGPNDLAFQTGLIACSLDALRVKSPSRRNTRVRPERFSPQELALKIGEHLLESAIQTEGEAVWIVPRSTSDDFSDGIGSNPVQLVTSDLYSGLSGIIFFLGHLARSSGDARFAALASAAGRSLWRRLGDGDLCERGGAFNGLAGAAYALAHLGSSISDSNWIDRAQSLVSDVLRLLEDSKNFDLISGVSGGVLVLLTVDAVATTNLGMERVKTLAGRLAEELRADLTGLPYQRGASHGLSGAIWALAVATKHFGEESSSMADLIQAELALTANGEWVDPSDSLHIGQATWCHGPPGIAICRSAAASILGCDSLRQGAIAALNGFQTRQNHTDLGLCHGVAGVMDAFEMGVTYNTAADRRKRERLLSRLLSGVGAEVETHQSFADVGLMTGLSGMGLQLLRLIDQKTPSVLLLQPPS